MAAAASSMPPRSPDVSPQLRDTERMSDQGTPRASRSAIQVFGCGSMEEEATRKGQRTLGQAASSASGCRARTERSSLFYQPQHEILEELQDNAASPCGLADPCKNMDARVPAAPGLPAAGPNATGTPRASTCTPRSRMAALASAVRCALRPASPSKPGDARGLRACEDDPTALGWADLPAHLVEQIMRELLPAPVRPELSAVRMTPTDELQARYAAVAVCRTWRAIGMPVLFGQDAWARGEGVVHPSQLLKTAPQDCGVSEVRCFLVRRPAPSSFNPLSPDCSFELWAGEHTDPRDQCRFLLSSKQVSKARFNLSLKRLSPAPAPPPQRRPAGVRVDVYEGVHTLAPQSVEGGAMADKAPSLGASLQSPKAGSSACVRLRPSAMSVGQLVGNLRRTEYQLRVDGCRPWVRAEIARGLRIGAPRGEPCPPCASGVGGGHGGSDVPGSGRTSVAPLALPRQPLLRVCYYMRMHGLLLPRRLVVDVLQPHGAPCTDGADAGSSNTSSVPSAHTDAPSPTGARAAARSLPSAGSDGIRRIVGSFGGRPGPADVVRSESSSAASVATTPSARDTRAAAANARVGTRNGRSRSRNGAHSALPVLSMRNTLPHWNEQLRCWCLNFHNRIKLPSIKNFQLQGIPGSTQAAAADGGAAAAGGAASTRRGRASREPATPLQFGKVEADVFVLDFNPCVLTAQQAFALALSNFERKLALWGSHVPPGEEEQLEEAEVPQAAAQV